jgi:hypothetical protein
VGTAKVFDMENRSIFEFVMTDEVIISVFEVDKFGVVMEGEMLPGGDWIVETALG